ncbi:MAG: tetratricopeptide repeat protein [Bacteroidota bacterium]
MDKEKQIKDGTDKTTLHLPMGQLFYLLYSNGFRVKPDDYIEMLKITERFGSKNIDETAKWICPIIATSEIEQAKFYNIIEQYKKITTAQTNEDYSKKRLIPRRIKIAIAVALAALLLLIVYLSRPPKVYLLEEKNKERSVEKGVPLFFDASNLLQDRPGDSSIIQFAWQFEDSSNQEGLKVTHVFNKPGDYLVKRRFASKSLQLSKKSDSLLVHVCKDLPKLHIRIPEGTIAAQQDINITADVEADSGTISYYQWKINDSTFLSRKPLVENASFSKKGDYSISCTAVVGEANSPCSVTDNETIHVEDNGLHYTAGFSASRAGSYAGRTKLKWWVTWILLLPAAAALLYSVLKRRPKSSTVHQNKQAQASLTKGPFDIPFEQNDIKLIQQERELRRTLIQMRYKAEEETLVLSVPGTISSIIRSGGSPQLVFAPLTQQQQYLVLIDRSNPKSLLTKLFGYLARIIADDGIPVNIFYYDKNFVCYNDKFPGGLTLQRLAETDSTATLIIMGRAQELVYSAYPLIEEKFLRELNRWQHKAIITPTPVKDWAVKEKILQEYIILVPADVMSLQKIIPALREKIKPHTSVFEITETRQYSLRDTDFREVNELKEYLDNDETLFQWLCAVCIYPRLKWEVLIEIGKAILDKYGEPEKLNYSNLLKLCRISWMQQGVFPQTTRLELLKQLTIDNELCAREKLLRMLNYSTSIYGENGHFFEEEKKRQQLTNQFILHANNSIHYSQYADSREGFKKIWKKDAILDMPVKKYLDKKSNDGWQTPVNNGNESVGLSAYFDLHEITLNKKLRLKRGLAAGAAILLFGLWTYIGYGGGAEKLAPLVTLNQDIGKQIIPISIKVVKDFGACGDSLKNNFDKVDGYVEINNDRVPLSYDQKTATASFDLLYGNMAAGKASIMLSWDSNKSVTAALAFTNQLLPDSITIGCVGSSSNSKVPLQIRYNDTSGYRDIESSLGDALFRYKIVSALQVDFTDSSRIVYYEPNQKSRADSVVQIIKDALGIDVKTEFVSEIRTPPAVPILFLNTGIYENANNEAANNKESANYYHAMGDEAFQRKAYLEAIQSYKRAIAMNPKDALAYYQSGVAYEMLGDAYSSKALEEYNSAIDINPADGLFWYRRASVKYGIKRYADAIKDYNKVITLNSDDTKTQYAYAIYFRGKSYYFLKILSSACIDFKKAGDMGVKAGKQDYGAYCNINNVIVKPDCNRIFNSLKEALSVDAAMVCKLDLSKEYITAFPKQVFGFKNLTQINLGSLALPQSEIDKLQKALPACKIIYAPQKNQTETDFGYIQLDEYGYTDAAGQQVMEKVSRLLKAQPGGKIRLTAFYTTGEEQKALTGYMNTIVNMFAKIGVNPKTQIEQQVSRDQNVRQQQQNAQLSTGKKMNIRVTGININENQNAAKKS